MAKCSDWLERHLESVKPLQAELIWSRGECQVLTGRRTDRLEASNQSFAVTHPNQTVWTFPLDVTDMAMVKTVCFSDIWKR